MTSDWGGYKAVVDAARDDDSESRENTSPDCPVCGTPLDVRPRDGARNCPMGHYRDNGKEPRG